MTSHLSCGFLFENDPVWLWAIRPNSWSSIHLTASDESKIRQSHPALFAKIRDKCVIIPSTFAADYPNIAPDFMWVCGSKCFVDLVSLPASGTHVYLLLKATRRLPSDLPHIQWVKLLHQNVGGMTNARATIGIDHRSKPIVVDRDLNRSIGHVIKYSVRPCVCDLIPSVSHYVLDDLLSLSFPRRPVVYPTYMSKTGWGMRELIDEELSSCFELPDYVPWIDRFLRDIVPLQLCRTVIDVVTRSETVDPPRPRPTMVIEDDDFGSTSNQDVVWLPLIEKWLPGNWADAAISDKAVKSDNAPVDFGPWHRRIQLVLPCPVATLSLFERFFMRKWRHTLIRSLFRFMRFMHGPMWYRLSDSELGKRRFMESSSVSAKRSRLIDEGSKGGVF